MSTQQLTRQVLIGSLAIGITSLLITDAQLLAQGAPPAGGSPASMPAAPATPAATETAALSGTSADVNGVFKVNVPVPGKARESTFTLKTDGKTLTGSLTNPYQPDAAVPLSDTTIKGNQFAFTAKIGNVDFNFSGTAGGGKLAMTMVSNEVVKLAPGSKIKTAQDTPVDGAYLVAVHAPNNSTMDNIFFLNTRGTVLNGKMVRIGGIKDSADFYDGSVTGSKVSFYAKNSMSTFRFDGSAEGSVLDLTMTITDMRYAVVGVKQ